MVTHNKYAAGTRAAYTGTLAALNDDTESDIRCALMDGNYTFSQSDTDWADISEHEITNNSNYNADGYTSPGRSLSALAVTHDGSAVTFDADDIVWSDATIDARGAVLFDNTPTNDTDKTLLTGIEFGYTESSAAGTFEVVWNTAGVFEVNTS